jgi:hypothetical protein
MHNSIPYLKRKLKNYNTLNKVGDLNLKHNIAQLSEVQQRKFAVDKQLKQANDALAQSAVFFQRQNDEVIIPELMANMSIYVNELVQEQQQKSQAVDMLSKDVDLKRQEVLKLKKSNQVVEDKMSLVNREVTDLYFKKMDEEVADLLQTKKQGAR